MASRNTEQRSPLSGCFSVPDTALGQTDTKTYCGNWEREETVCTIFSAEESPVTLKASGSQSGSVPI